MSGRDEREEEYKESLWMKVGDGNGSGLGGWRLANEMVFALFISAVSLSSSKPSTSSSQCN